jgi:O-antigen/teichoic acid export membrane protein
MPQGLAGKILQAGRSQFLGLGAQLIAAAPIIAVSIYLSRSVGLAAVADFAMLIGVSSVAFTLGMVGLRSRLVLDRFRDFPEGSYYNLRIAATGPMALVILATGFALGAPPLLALGVAFLRVGDAALDLVLSVDQVRREERAHMYGYLHGSTFKLAILLLALGIAELTDWVHPTAAIALAGLIYAIHAWMLLLRRRLETAPLLTPGAIAAARRLLRNSIVFAVAQVICSVLTNTPRLTLPLIADRQLAGAAGAALSASTFLGMSYFAVWLRWIPRFGLNGVGLRKAGMFGSELCLMFVSMVAAIWTIGGAMMGVLFALPEPEQRRVATQTLLASAVFFLLMTLANLFKPSRCPWGESIVYVGGIAGALLSISRPGVPQIPALLFAACIGMSVAATAVLVYLKFTQEGRNPYA